MNPNLTGRKPITVVFDLPDDATPETQPRTEEINVRQIPLRDWDRGFAHFTDELALVGFLAGKSKEWVTGKDKITGLSPKSYNEILTFGREVNQEGFFDFCRRRMEAKVEMEQRGQAYLDAQREVRMAEAFGRLPAALRDLILNRGQAVVEATTSPTSSSPSPSPQT